ncbi:MAG: LptF/LptG family permease, partial [Planctomycetia bacterium]
MLTDLLQVFLVTLAALTFFMVVVGLVQTASKEGLGPLQIALLVPYVLPDALRIAVPGTMLFAAASIFGRMSASNEITALKAAGITPLAAIWPAIAVALVVSFVSV